jgi:hypothetical protein
MAIRGIVVFRNYGITIFCTTIDGDHARNEKSEFLAFFRWQKKFKFAAILGCVHEKVRAD